MGRADAGESRRAPVVAIGGVAVVSGGLAYAVLRVSGDLSRLAGSVAIGVAAVLAMIAVLSLIVVVNSLTSAPGDPRADRTPTGGQPVWFTRLDAGVSAERVAPAGPVITIGAAADADVRLDGPGVALAHARVRIWPGLVDLGRLGRGRVRVDGRTLARGAWQPLTDGAIVTVGRHRLRVSVGWEPDPADPRVGTRVGPHLLVRRAGPTPWGGRYLTGDAVVQRLDRRPLTDDELARYAAASAAARGRSPVVASVATLRDADGTPVLVWPVTDPSAPSVVTPEAVFRLCDRLAHLHAAGMAHGALTPWHRLPGGARDLSFAAALPTLDRDDRGGAPYRAAGRDPAAPSGPDDDEFVAPEQGAGAAPSPRGDVFALATWLGASLVTAPHLRESPAWAALLRGARAEAPAARPADAAALALAILRAAALTDPSGRFADKTFAACARCGERLVAEDPPRETMFDGVDADGRRSGGRHLVWSAGCVGCGHDATRQELQRY